MEIATSKSHWMHYWTSMTWTLFSAVKN
jgi:hypothetical protein